MGGGDPSWSECRACGAHGCPSSPLIDPPPALAELGTASSEPSGAARALDETFPLTRPANSDFHQPLEQPLRPSAPVLVDQQAPNEIPTTTPEPTLIAAALHQEQQAINPAIRQYMGESSAPPPPPPPPPQSLPDNEVPIQRVDERLDYPPPGHRPFGGEDLRRRGMRRPFPGSGSGSDQGRGYEYISLISDLGRHRCRQYYPNDHYLNNRPSYRRVDIWNGHNSSNCELPRTRRSARERVPASNCFPDGADGSNYVPPLRRWNTCPVREPASNSNSFPPRENDHQDQPAAGRQPAAGEGTVVQDNIVIGDPTRVRIGEGNRGGRSTRGRVTGNVVVR